MKKITSMLLAAILLMGIFAASPVGASAASASKYVTVEKQKTYQLNDGRSVTYRIPKINLNGSDAADANKAIKKAYSSIFTATEDAIKKKFYDVNKSLDYEAYLNGSILSVVITNAYPWNQYIEYDVYNFNVKTGKRVENKVILSAKNTTFSAAKNNIKALIRKEYVSILDANKSSEVGLKAAKSQLTESLKDASLKKSRFYLDAKGALSAMYPIHMPAGAGQYYRNTSLKAYATTPKNVKFENANAGIKLKWDKVKGAAKYRVYVKTSSGWKKAGDVSKPAFTYKTTASGKKYTFTVRALDKQGNSISNVNGKGFTDTFVAAPALPTVTNSSPCIKVSWKKVKGASVYRVFRKTAGTKWQMLTDTTSTVLIDAKVKRGVKYAYTIRCVSKDGKKYISGYNAKGKVITCK